MVKGTDGVSASTSQNHPPMWSRPIQVPTEALTFIYLDMPLQFNIMDLIRERPNTMICVSAGELSLFARELLTSARQEYERRMEAEARNAEEYLSAEEVKAILGVSDSTLYRFGKSGILRATWVGGQRRWRKHDLDTLLKNGR